MSPSTRRGVTEQAAIAAIDSGTRVLRLPTIRDRFKEIAAAAEREQMSYLGFSPSWSWPSATTGTSAAQHGASTTPASPATSVEEFDFAANSSVNPAVIHQMATCAWVKPGTRCA